MSFTSAMTSTDFYNSEYGRIAILMGDNYPIFQLTCCTALVVANAWDIVSSDEQKPAANRPPDYDDQVRRAIQLISSSVAPYLLKKIYPYVLRADPQGMWNELAKENRVLDQVYQDTLVGRFAKETWSPQTETLWTYITRLDTYRMRLTGTENEITEAQMRTKLLHSLPDDELWQQAKYFCLCEKRDWNSTVALLQSYEQPPSTMTSLPAIPATVAAVHDRASRRGIRRRGGGGRGNSRSTDRNSTDRNSTDRNSTDRNRGRSADRTDHSANRIKKDQCRFCLKRGHFQADCRAYKAAQAQVLKGSGKDEGNVNIFRDH